MLVEHLLENELKQLANSGRYHVISEFAPWLEGRMARFHKQCVADVINARRQIRIRRIFIALPEDVDRCAQLLEVHLASMRRKTTNTGEYLVKLCTEAAVKARFPGGPCGFFIPPGAASADARFVVKETPNDTLSDFILPRDDADDRGRIFEDLWQDKATTSFSKNDDTNVTNWILRTLGKRPASAPRRSRASSYVSRARKRR